MSIVSATIIKLKLAAGACTLSKTPQGPQRSITLTLSETTMATLIVPFAGDVSLALAVGIPFTPSILGAPGEPSANAGDMAATAETAPRRKFLRSMDFSLLEAR